MTLTTLDTPPQAPTKPDGSLYRFELLYNGLDRRAYADTPEELVTVLIPGYPTLSEDEAWEARLHLATIAQVTVQAVINQHTAFTNLPDWQQQILLAPRHTPVAVPTWDCPIPLILISNHYMPAGNTPPPVSNQGMPPNVIWLDTSTELSLLESLHDIGFINLNTSD